VAVLTELIGDRSAAALERFRMPHDNMIVPKKSSKLKGEKPVRHVIKPFAGARIFSPLRLTHGVCSP
jgi:hypothetical protein